MDAANKLEMNGSMLKLVSQDGQKESQRQQSWKANHTDSVFESKQTRSTRSSCHTMMVPRVCLVGASETWEQRGKATAKSTLPVTPTIGSKK